MARKQLVDFSIDRSKTNVGYKELLSGDTNRNSIRKDKSLRHNCTTGRGLRTYACSIRFETNDQDEIRVPKKTQNVDSSNS